MAYIVTIEETIQSDNPDDYRNKRDVFKQRVENMDLIRVIRAVNGIEPDQEKKA